MKHFKAPRKSFGKLDSDASATLIAAASDVALVLDGRGIIRDVAFSNDELARELERKRDWIGREWSETVTEESRPKVAELLRESADGGVSSARQMNHPGADADVPVMYSAIRIAAGQMVALGRDMRALVRLQQRLLETQRSMDREYSRLRNYEVRYRLLFETVGEPLLMVDAARLTVIEGNPAAARLFDLAPATLVGRPVTALFRRADFTALQSQLELARRTGQIAGAAMRVAASGVEVTVSARLLREDGASLLLLSVMPADLRAPPPAMAAADHLRLLAAHAVDAMAVTDRDGRILAVNAAFADLLHLPTEDHARGEPLSRWVGRTDVDFDVLVGNLRRNATVRQFNTVARPDYAQPIAVEVGARAVEQDGLQFIDFTIRDVSRQGGSTEPVLPIARSVDRIKELVGRSSLKDMVRESTDVIERMCIEAALELTGNNRASAAELLGLSRQSLYVKLRRHGMVDGHDGEAGE